ncbi:MAG: CARDB domain-containing protein [Nanoarchaeota archaeon]
MRKATLALIVLIVLALPLTSAAHYIVGEVSDALDETAANDHDVVLWNPSNGIDDNLTDIIGPNGNSGVDNLYFIDCELLDSSCSVGDEIRVKVTNNGDDYITGYVNITVTGAGFDTMPDLTLNSPPNITLDSPENYGNRTAPVNFNCTANDLDSNLANVTLYGNWSNGWHANETLAATGSSDTITFTKNISDGTYIWSCLIKDNLSISRFAEQNYTLTVDSTPPEITSIELNLSGDLCGLENYVRVNCTATDSSMGIDTVQIQASKPSGSTYHLAQVLAGDTYYVDILLNETGTWSFNCIANDTLNNTANLTATETLRVRSVLADLIISSSDIVFSNLNPIENALVMINATIYNEGCGDANNFLIGFYENDPDSGGTQINGNQTLSLSSGQNNTINVTWSAEIGHNNIFVYADFNNSINETNETNNKANNSIDVGAWQDFYGNVTIDKILGDANVRNLSAWINETSLSGNIFIADTESNIDWQSLQAIGRNTSNDATSNDFTEIDSFLNMSSFVDSVSDTFTTDGSTPLTLENFLVHQQTIQNVPIVNSTNNTNFITGILWDTSDSSDDEYGDGASDKEDLVFAAKVNKATEGAYGIYDYEITIPVRLREYDSTDTNNVYIYFDLN